MCYAPSGSSSQRSKLLPERRERRARLRATPSIRLLKSPTHFGFEFLD